MVDEFVSQVFYPSMVAGVIAPAFGALLGMVYRGVWHFLTFEV